MYNFKYISCFESSRNSLEMFRKIGEGQRMTAMLNNQRFGYLIPDSDSTLKWLSKGKVMASVKQKENYFDAMLAEDWRQIFIEKNGVQEAEEGHLIDRLLGRDGSELMRELPVKDHYVLWLKDGQPRLFTTHLYGLGMETANALREFCLKYGLTYRIEKRSWHLPGVSFLVVIKRDRD